MQKAKLLSISAFSWATVTRYIVYITCEAGLQEINSYHVSSFPLGRLGCDKLIARKTKVLATVRANQQYLERFVGKYSDELEKPELAVVRSMYRQYTSDAETLEGHIEVAKEFKRANQLVIEHMAKEQQNEFPF